MKLIFACDRNGGIGYQNTLPWPKNIADIKWFRRHTINKNVVMGHNTYLSLDSLGVFPLDFRNNIVLTSKTDNTIDDCRTINSFDQIPHDAMIIGGASLYKQALDSGKVTEIYFTLIPGIYECDTYFPLKPSELLERYELNEFYSIKDTKFHVLTCK